MRRGLAGTLLILGGVGLALAGEYGKIAGRVIDSQTGDPLPGVAVVIEETRQGTYTDANGYYVILRVSPGTYTVKASMIGYAPTVIKGVKVDADRTTELSIKLTPEAITTKEIVVEAKEPIIKKDLTASVNKIRGEQIQAMPVTSVTQAITLQAGVRSYGGFLQVRGGRPGEVAFVVDGAEVRDPYSGYQDIQLPLDAIQETSVSKGGFGAEYGSAASGVVSIVTKEAGDKPELNVTVRHTLPWGFFYEDPADPYMKWFTRDYLKHDPYSFDSIFSYETQRWIKYDSMGIDNTEAPKFFYSKYWDPDEQQFTLPVDHNENLSRYQISFGTPIPGTNKNLRLYTSWDIIYNGTRFPNNQDDQKNWQAKLTWTPTNSLKLFFSTLGTNRLMGIYSPYWRIALTHLPVHRAQSKQFVGGVNYLFSTKTYVELRAGLFDTWNRGDVFEDVNMNGIDDFSDRDLDGYPEVDPLAMDLMGKYIDPTWIREEGPDNNNDGVPDWVELNMYWWETDMVSLHPSMTYGRYRSDYIVMVVKGFKDTTGIPGVEPGDTITFDVSDPALDYIIGDTLMRIGNIYTPNMSTWYRTPFHYDHSKVLNAKVDLVAQDGFNLKGHEWKMGLEYTGYHVTRTTEDYASGGNIYTNEVNAKPWKMAAYVRDKMEFQGMIANVGFRFDYFNPNAWVPSDPWHPVKDYTWPKASDTVWANHPEVRDTYLLRDPVRAPSSWYISPRIGISHPISERDVLHFTYGHYFQEPLMRYLFMNQYYFFTGAFPIMGNPALKPEKTISYEVGVKHAFSSNLVIDFTAFYKDVSDLVQSKRYDFAGGMNYTTFVNQDFASIRGFEVQFSKLPGGFLPYLSWEVNYTFQVAKGSFSSPFASYSYSWARLPLSYSEEHYLDWDERHSISFILSWMVPVQENMLASGYGVSLLYSYGSGTPWSPPIRDIRDALEKTNTLRMPSHSNWDMRLYKDFGTQKTGVRLFANIYNLFNNRNITGYNDEQLWYYFRDPEGEVKDPTVYSARRVTRVGFQFYWRP